MTTMDLLARLDPATLALLFGFTLACAATLLGFVVTLTTIARAALRHYLGRWRGVRLSVRG